MENEYEEFEKEKERCRASISAIASRIDRLDVLIYAERLLEHIEKAGH
jgi:hypothetical protein